MEMKITDKKEVTHKIEHGEKYTVVFRKIGTNCRKIMVLNGLYHNYPNDSWIGHDSEDGRCDPIQNRVYFDGANISNKEILFVGKDSDWQRFWKLTF